VTSARVVLNRAALDQVTLALADGMFALAQKIVDTAHPPDDPPYGEGLVTEGAAICWVNGRKVASTPARPIEKIEEHVTGGSFGHAVQFHKTRKVGGTPTKPRGLKLDSPGITAVAGFGFPGRFNEIGTVHQPARPFLSPAAAEVLPDAPITLSRAMAKRLARA